MEPTIIKATAFSSTLTASAGCQTMVTASSIAADARTTDKTQTVIEANMKRAVIFARDWLDETEDTSDHFNELTPLWQNDRAALQAHVSLLRGLRKIVETEREEVRKQRRLADDASAAVRQLDQAKSQLERDHHDLKLREREYQNQIDALLINVTVLEVPDAALDDTNKNSLVTLDYLLSSIGH